MLFNLFKAQYATDTVVYVGYSHADANWRSVTAAMRREFAPSSPPPAYRVSPTTPALRREVLAGQGLQTIEADITEFAHALDGVAVLGLEDSHAPAYPSDLAPLAENQPIAVRRLVSSWEYVPAVDFSVTPNTHAFLRGAPPSWSLVGSGINFERDTEKDVLDDIVDCITSSAQPVRTWVVLGSAGYGTTTLLMAITAWLAKGRAAPIFYLKPGGAVLSGDVEFAARRLGQCLFVVDNASDHLSEIQVAQKNLRAANLPGLFLLGERLNEWRSRRASLGSEWLIEPLSDEEIYRLIDALELNGELGVMRDLSPDLRFAAVKVKNSQELLVTLREVTEGKAFDAIIEDEYYGIDDPLARRLYLTVSCFARARALMRVELASSINDIGSVDLYAQVLPHLEGVLRFEDLPGGGEALTTRHHSIGALIWERAGDRVERQVLARDCINKLNLAFGADNKAFEAMTRNDSLVDDFDSLDARTGFFEAALRKAPDNAYIRQHYARMLRRSNKLDIALREIDEAIEMASGNRTFHHTRGVILRDLAMSAATPDLGRKWLAQAESAFLTCLRLAPRDEYAYASLAELYVGWAEKLEGQLDCLPYISKAEETVQDALTRVRETESIHVVAARIEAFVGDRPGQVAALRKAIAQNPRAVTARYLLGSALTRQGELQEALAELEAGLLLQPDHPRLARAYALAVEALADDLHKGIAVLAQAAYNGSRDHRFVALHGGMLEMIGEVQKSADVFREAKRRDWSVAAKHTIGYEPLAPPWSGRVASIKGGFAFLRVPGHSDVFCSARTFPAGLSTESEVSFNVVFTVRGPTAAQVRLI